MLFQGQGNEKTTRLVKSEICFSKFKRLYTIKRNFKHDDFTLIVHLPFLIGEVPCRPSYEVYISQLIRFARVCSHVADFNARNKCLTGKLLKQGYRYCGILLTL